MKAGTVDVEDGQENIRCGIVELLGKRVHLANELALLHGHVLLHAVVTLQLVSKVFCILNPRKWITIQENWENILLCPGLLAKYQTCSL